jgi:hypothetical protein
VAARLSPPASAGTLAGVAPGWLRITRRGETFTSFWSTDGVHFTQIGSVSVLMNTASRSASR